MSDIPHCCFCGELASRVVDDSAMCGDCAVAYIKNRGRGNVSIDEEDEEA